MQLAENKRTLCSQRAVCDENAIFETYPEGQQRAAVKYRIAMNLFEKNRLKPGKIAKILKIDRQTACGWIQHRKTPFPIKAINRLEQVGLFPLCIDELNPKHLLFVKIFAFILGDGHLVRNLKFVTLYGNKKDLETIQHEIDEMINQKSEPDFTGQAQLKHGG